MTEGFLYSLPLGHTAKPLVPRHLQFRDVVEQRNELDVDTLVFDTELSPGQLKRIEDVVSESGNTRVKVVDRTTLILNIFKQNARSIEGKLQVGTQALG